MVTWMETRRSLVGLGVLLFVNLGVEAKAEEQAAQPAPACHACIMDFAEYFNAPGDCEDTQWQVYFINCSVDHCPGDEDSALLLRKFWMDNCFKKKKISTEVSEDTIGLD